MQNMPLTSEIFTRKPNRSFEVCVYTYYMYLQNQFLYFDGTPPEHDMQVKTFEITSTKHISVILKFSETVTTRRLKHRPYV